MATWNIEDLEPIDLDGEDGDQGQGGQGGGEDDQEQDGQGGGGDDQESKDGKGKGKKANGDPSGAGENGDMDDSKIDKIDEHHKEIEKQISKAKDLNSDEAQDASKKAQAGSGAGKANRNHGAGKDGPPQKFDYSKVKPVPWGSLIKKMIADASKDTEDTYNRPNRKNITGLEIARQTGAAAMKPGEIIKDKEVKIVFIVDSSGSMTHIIDKIYASIDHLLKTNKAVGASNFYLIKYSSEHHIYKCNFGKKSYVKLSSINDKEAVMEKGSIDKLFSEHLGNATNFSRELVNDVEKLVGQRYNALVITDDDILASSNFDNLVKLFKVTKNQLHVIADSRQTFENLLKSLGTISKNVSYFD